MDIVRAAEAKPSGASGVIKDFGTVRFSALRGGAQCDPSSFQPLAAPWPLR